MITEFPQRPKQHEIDTRGSNLLSYVLPKEYIFRFLGERDYGIDGLIELALGGQVSGVFLSVQLKSSENVHWTKDGTVKINIPKTTCNYWMQNTMPVLLFLADLSTQKVYYGDVKAQLKKRYVDYITNNSFSFILSNKNELHFPIQQNIQNEDDYIIAYGFQFRFMAFVLSMVRRPTFEANLKEFVSNWRRYFEHLKHQGADPFLLQPISFYEQTIHIHNCMLYISSELNLEMQGIDFQTIKNNLEEMYEYYEAIPRYEVLEHEITVLHSQIQEYIEIIILGIKNHVLIIEKDFWRLKFSNVYQEAKKMDWNSGEH